MQCCNVLPASSRDPLPTIPIVPAIPLLSKKRKGSQKKQVNLISLSAKSAYLLFFHTSQLQPLPIIQSFKRGKVIQARQATLGRSREQVAGVVYTMGSVQSAAGPTVWSSDYAEQRLCSVSELLPRLCNSIPFAWHSLRGC